MRHFQLLQLFKVLKLASFVLTTVLLFTSFKGSGQEEYSIFLIGDCGEHTQPGPALRHLQSQLAITPNSTVVFLGDNIYKRGLTKNRDGVIHPKERDKLHTQLDILQGYKGHAYFVPGNHDWHYGRVKGRKTLKNQEVHVDSIMQAWSIEGGFYPKDGFPGPHSVKVAPGIRLILVDTQWWLHTASIFHKVPTGGRSKNEVKADFFQALDSLLRLSSDQNEAVVVAMHHPFYTNGPHGTKKQPLRFLNNNTPFQIFPGQFGTNRLFVQDVYQPKYKRMIRSFEELLNQYDDVFIASGHDHSLQYIQRDGQHYLVSGAGSKLSEIKVHPHIPGTIYASDGATGYFRLDYAGGRLTRMVVIDGRSGEADFEQEF